MSAADQEQLIAQLKAQVTALKSSCLSLQSQPKASCSLEAQKEKLEREVQLARRQYDQAIADRRTQAEALELLMTQFHELQASGGVAQTETAVQRQIRQLQSALQCTARQVNQAAAVQQQYQDVLQQLKDGHEQFDEELEHLKAQVQKQQDTICERRAHLLQVQHARDAAKKDLQAAEQQLTKNRADRSKCLHQQAQQCQLQIQQQLQTSLFDPEQHYSHLDQLPECFQLDLALAADSSSAPVAAACNCGDSSLTRPCTCKCSAAECVSELLKVTKCSSPQGLILYVQALLQARSSLQLAAEAANTLSL